MGSHLFKLLFTDRFDIHPSQVAICELIIESDCLNKRTDWSKLYAFLLFLFFLSYFWVIKTHTCFCTLFSLSFLCFFQNITFRVTKLPNTCSFCILISSLMERSLQYGMCFFWIYSWFCFHTQVAFRAQLSTNSESIVLLDDVSVQTGACSPRGSCDFESGKCTWVNVANGVIDGRDWINADGHYSGPLVDYTTHTADGESLLLYLLCLLILQTFFTSQMIYSIRTAV